MLFKEMARRRTEALRRIASPFFWTFYLGEVICVATAIIMLCEYGLANVQGYLEVFWIWVQIITFAVCVGAFWYYLLQIYRTNLANRNLANNNPANGNDNDAEVKYRSYVFNSYCMVSLVDLLFHYFIFFIFVIIIDAHLLFFALFSWKIVRIHIIFTQLQCSFEL